MVFNLNFQVFGNNLEVLNECMGKMFILNCFEVNIKLFIVSYEFSIDGRLYLIIFEVVMNQSCKLFGSYVNCKKKEVDFFYYVYYFVMIDCSRRCYGQIVNFK